MKILITGGSGYIGSHTCIELIEHGYDIIVIDNLSNSSLESLKRIERLTNYKIPFFKVDIRDKQALSQIFKKFSIDYVIHLAGKKSVNESIENPFDYYHINVSGTLVLLEVMQEFNCKSIVFSSSATVYGSSNNSPIDESFPLEPENPYGRTKLIIEKFLHDLYNADGDWRIAILRYFNPIGAHNSGEIGEDPKGIPSNLIPFISQVAIGKLAKLKIFGTDYETIDGTGVRDYIHVVDIAEGHLKAVQSLEEGAQLFVVNLGTGNGYSVFEIISAFEKASGKKIPFEIIDRRHGDVGSCYTNPSFAEKKLNWRAKRKLNVMCEDTWKWQSLNPNGYHN